MNEVDESHYVRQLKFKTLLLYHHMSIQFKLILFFFTRSFIQLNLINLYKFNYERWIFMICDHGLNRSNNNKNNGISFMKHEESWLASDKIMRKNSFFLWFNKLLLSYALMLLP